MRNLAAIALPCLLASITSAAAQTPTAILVDKKTNTLKVAHYKDDVLEVIKSYHATVGQVVGDKIDEGDLKTPEGIYSFTATLRPPQLKPKFGTLALQMDYPNVFDRLAGSTGHDIMLHATNEPDRLKNDYDSEGCVVVKNEEIEEIQQYVSIGLTPILIFSELKNEYLSPGKDVQLRQFFLSWVSAWEGKQIDEYASRYHSAFVGQGMNLPAWRDYKAALNQKYDEIHVGPDKVQYFVHPKYSMIMFIQNYASKFKNGQNAYHSRGTKTLIIAEEDSHLKIIDESFTPRTW